VLGRRVHGARVLDLFAGAGALGFEAIARGAASVVCGGNDGAAAFASGRNALHRIEDEERWRFLRMLAGRALRTLRGTFDVILIDPPYDRGAADELALLMQRGLLAPDGIAVVEHRSKETLALPTSMKLIKTSKYGDTSLTFAGVRTERELQASERSADDGRPRSPRS
ncbi:MAG: RsmD family RNA methyltransferase, partial [Candidatus Eremiobacterales bacterium]